MFICYLTFQSTRDSYCIWLNHLRSRSHLLHNTRMELWSFGTSGGVSARYRPPCRNPASSLVTIPALQNPPLPVAETTLVYRLALHLLNWGLTYFYTQGSRMQVNSGSRSQFNLPLCFSITRKVPPKAPWNAVALFVVPPSPSSKRQNEKRS